MGTIVQDCGESDAVALATSLTPNLDFPYQSY
jgi:hypothetical protein